MQWKKKGLVWQPDSNEEWIDNSALQPTPILIDGVIRVYVGFRDSEGVSRIGYVDLDPENPSDIIDVSNQPVLDVGKAGSFDDNGVVPAAVVKRDNNIYLYYAGYKKEQKVRFSVFGGLAISGDQGRSFTRYKKVPVIERSDDATLFRVIHSIIEENQTWRVWYCAGSSFINGKNKTLPRYEIRYQESNDGLSFSEEGESVLELRGNEFRHGRPYVFKDDIYRMFYAVATKSEGYRLGYAESKNGHSWNRKDNLVGIDVSNSGWDSKMMSYPSIVQYKNNTYLFYNGNNMGYSGFGYAVLNKEW